MIALAFFIGSIVTATIVYAVTMKKLAGKKEHTPSIPPILEENKQEETLKMDDYQHV